MRQPAPRASTSSSNLALVGLFPAFEIDNAGGVQVSGRLAWEAIQGKLGSAAHAVQVDLSRTAPATQTPYTAVLHTRRAALWHLMHGRRSAAIVLAWHAALLPLTSITAGRRVLFLHGIEAWRSPGRLRARLYHRLNLLLANSEYTLQRAQSASPALRALPSAVVPLGVTDQAATQAPDEPPAALMIGRLDRRERYKGHEAALAAWPSVRERVPGARLWIVGEGNLRRELEQRARTYGLSDAIRFYGRVDESDKESLLQRARCLIMPSRAEGFGLVYAEAMRAGRPCLIGLGDAAREVVNPPQCGLGVDPDDIRALADATVALLTAGPQWDAWSRACRQRYLERYTAQAFQARLLDALGLF